VADHGLDALELSLNRRPDLFCYDVELAGRCRSEAERLGVALTAHAPEDAWLCDPDSVPAATAAELLRERVEGMVRFGVRRVVVHACPYRPRVPDREEEQAESLYRSLAFLADPCETWGVSLLTETMTRQADGYTSTLDHVITAVDRVGSSRIGICLDTNHINTCEPLVPAVLRAGARIGECHCNDNHGEKEEHLLPFDGAIDWAEFARALASIGFDGALILEPSHFDQDKYTDLLSATADAVVRLRACLAQAALPA